MGQSRPLFVYFRHFLITISIIQMEKNLDGVVGIRTRGRMMVGDTRELWLKFNLIVFRLTNCIAKGM